MRTTLSTFGSIDLLVNNAGINTDRAVARSLRG